MSKLPGSTAANEAQFVMVTTSDGKLVTPDTAMPHGNPSTTSNEADANEQPPAKPQPPAGGEGTAGPPVVNEGVAPTPGPADNATAWVPKKTSR